MEFIFGVAFGFICGVAFVCALAAPKATSRRSGGVRRW